MNSNIPNLLDLRGKVEFLEQIAPGTAALRDARELLARFEKLAAQVDAANKELDNLLNITKLDELNTHPLVIRTAVQVYGIKNS